MHEIAFADAARPARFTILHLVMLDYSIGHDLLLLRHRNPLALLSPQDFDALDAAEQCHAVARAVLICSRNWEENKNRNRWLSLWNLLNRNANWPLSIADFRNYRTQGHASPPITPVNNKGGRSPGAPFHANLIQFLVGQLHITELQAYDYPLSLAKFHYYSFSEDAGGIKITNLEEQSFLDFCEREDAKEAAELKAKEEKCPR